MTNKYRILIFAHDSSFYGASLSLLTLLEYWSKNDMFELFVLFPYKGKMQERLLELNIKSKVINFPRCITVEKLSIIKRIKRGIQFLANSYSYKENIFKNILVKYKPDLICTNTSVVSIGYELAKKYKIPHVWHIREFGDLDFNFNYLPFYGWVKKKINKSNKIIFVSKALRKHWTNSNSEKYSVIYNGIIDENSVKPKTLQLNTEKIVFSIVGAIMPAKGQDIAVKALIKIIEKYPNCYLNIYGDIVNREYYDKLQGIITVSKFKNNISIFPYTDSEIIYKKTSVLLSCSKMEGMGRTIIEAMSNGIPVIANASGGPVEIIEDLKDGLLYKSTEDELVKTIIYLITNPEVYTKISNYGIKKAYNLFNIETYASLVSNVFLDVLKQKHNYK